MHACGSCWQSLPLQPCSPSSEELDPSSCGVRNDALLGRWRTPGRCVEPYYRHALQACIAAPYCRHVLQACTAGMWFRPRPRMPLLITQCRCSSCGRGGSVAAGTASMRGKSIGDRQAVRLRGGPAQSDGVRQQVTRPRNTRAHAAWTFAVNALPPRSCTLCSHRWPSHSDGLQHRLGPAPPVRRATENAQHHMHGAACTMGGSSTARVNAVHRRTTAVSPRAFADMQREVHRWGTCMRHMHGGVYESRKAALRDLTQEPCCHGGMRDPKGHGGKCQRM